MAVTDEDCRSPVLIKKEDIKISVEEQKLLESSGTNNNCVTETLFTCETEPKISTDYINDYITPEMNYKESTNCKSPPVVTIRDTTGMTWNGEKDDISLYGTPKEEMIPGIAEVKGPSFMRSQIEALFQPSGKLSKL